MRNQWSASMIDDPQLGERELFVPDTRVRVSNLQSEPRPVERLRDTATLNPPDATYPGEEKSQASARARESDYGPRNKNSPYFHTHVCNHAS